MKHTHGFFILTVAGPLLAIGCGSAAIPQEQLTAAQASAKAAEVAGAPQNPQAALHLKKANEQIERAQQLIANDETEQAKRMLDRARADADLAIALAQEATTRAEAQAARAEVEDYKRELAKQ